MCRAARARCMSRSSLDGSIVQRTSFLNDVEFQRLLAHARPSYIERRDLWAFVARLDLALSALAPALFEAMQHETGFTSADCAELLEGTQAYLRGYRDVLEQWERTPTASVAYRLGADARQIQLTRVGWGTVAIVLPQNAFLLIAITALLNALAADNAIILRAPNSRRALPRFLRWPSGRLRHHGLRSAWCWCGR